MIIAEKLKQGDKIRVISPSRSLSLINDEGLNFAVKRLNDIGLEVDFSKNAREMDDFCSSSIESRIADLHDAFADKSVKGILTTIGGFNSNQLLRYIDYDLIKANPKILCGFSDITVLANAIYAKTGLVTYSGLHFSSFSMEKGFDFSREHFCKCLMQEDEILLSPSKEWSNDTWFLDQNDRDFIKNDGYKIENKGNLQNIKGTIIGGNIDTFGALYGTEFFPTFPESTVLFIEECDEQTPQFFDRHLQSLIHQPHFDNVKAILIGRFEKSTKMTDDLLQQIIKSKKELDNILVISGMDFGHTTPAITFPIGGSCEINATNDLSIKIKRH